MSSSTASSSASESSPPPRVRADTRPVERPEAQRPYQSASYHGYDGAYDEGNSRARAFPLRPGSDRKRRLTSTGEDARPQQWGRSEGTAGPARENVGSSRSLLPHRSVSMVLPSSRTRASISAAPGSSIATAIDIDSSSPITTRSFSGEQLSRRERRENPNPDTNQPRTISSHHINPHSPVVEMSLPKWQADSDVSECPICGTVFSFWHRKHHCRKCGRVVCAACSPHRITIPRQFIVRPPEFADNHIDSSPTPPSRSPQVVDLTGDDPVPSTINPALGGGEEVRLCNPCVPDPNPNPLGFSTVRAHGHRSAHSLSSAMINPYALPVSSITISTQCLLTNMKTQGGIQNLEARQERRTVGANDRPQFLHELSSQPQPVPSPSGTRQRRAMSSRDGRQLLEEGDFCPVCRRRFPPLSPEQPIEARQAHTRDCIENYLRPTLPRPSSVQQGPPLPPPPPSARMLPFVATEKDCLGEDGQAAECTICMEDYEVGQTLARLECLCKFHKHCIVDWFERKTECPVHKLS